MKEKGTVNPAIAQFKGLVECIVYTEVFNMLYTEVFNISS